MCWSTLISIRTCLDGIPGILKYTKDSRRVRRQPASQRVRGQAIFQDVLICDPVRRVSLNCSYLSEFTRLPLAASRLSNSCEPASHVFEVEPQILVPFCFRPSFLYATRHLSLLTFRNCFICSIACRLVVCCSILD